MNQNYLYTKKNEQDKTIIEIKNNKIGQGHFTFIAGPCSVESYEQFFTTASALKKTGVNIIRGGVFKPRTSPYSFQGLKEEGIKILSYVKKELDISVVTEITSVKQIDLFKDIDIIQIGARNMQNFEFLKEIAKLKKPVILKRGFSNTIDEFLLSAEYLLINGCHNIILCERGIRTFEYKTRNTLDISAIPIIKELTHLPIIIDPSHSGGIDRLVYPLSLSSIYAGSDGIIVEVHNDPKNALSDGEQSITPKDFEKLYANANKIFNYKLENNI